MAASTTALTNSEASSDTRDHAEQVSDTDYNQIIWVDPSSLTIGPNIRQENATPDRALVRDYKNNGVEDPIKAYRDEAGDLIVVDGQLRTLGAIEAGIDNVPVWVQPPPAADDKAATISRISKQFRLNRHRRATTRKDEFQAFEQLELLGMSPTAIGRELSVRRRDVTASLRVGRSEVATKAGDEHDLTLDQLAVIAEFEADGDLDAAQLLIDTAVERPNNFAALAQRRRNDRIEAERLRKSVEACTEQLTDAGIVIFDESLVPWHGMARSLDRLRPSVADEPDTELALEAHAGCPGHGAWIDFDPDENGQEVAVPLYGCSDFRAHGHALIEVPVGHMDYDGIATTRYNSDASEDGLAAAESALAQAQARELERRKASIQRKWVINNNKDADAALPARQEWLASVARRASLPKGTRRWLAYRTLDGSHTLRKAMERGHALAHRLLGLPEPSPTWYVVARESAHTGSELYDRIANATEAKAMVYELYLVLCAFEEGFRRDSWRNPSAIDQLYISMAIELGYVAPDVDLKVLNPDDIDDVIADALAAEVELDDEPAAADIDVDDIAA
jgi:ParB family chromosome partitioning protein